MYDGFFALPVGTFAGSPSYYGTFDQNGNAPEWTETYYPAGFGRIYRDSSVFDSAEFLSAERFRSASATTSGIALRIGSIAAIPEPSSTLVVLGLLAAGLGVMRLRKR